MTELEKHLTKKLESELLVYKDEINYMKIFQHMLSPKFFSNIIIFGYLINPFPVLKCPLYTLLFTNAVLATYMFIFNWKQIGNKFLKVVCFDNNVVADTLSFENLYQKYKNELTIIRILGILLHWLPLLFIKNCCLKSDFIQCSLIAISIGIFYLFTFNNHYGKIPMVQYIIMYGFVLLGFNGYIHK